MTMVKRLGMLLSFIGVSVLYAQQTSDYLIVEAPMGTKPASSVVWIKWSGTSRDPLNITYLAPDSGTIYYDRSPGGGKLSNYRYKVTTPWIDTLSGQKQDNIFLREVPPRRATAFKPMDQADMQSGVFYCVVAWPLKNDTLYSNEFQVFIESPNAVTLTAPKSTITDLTPTFQWNPNPGVPYYHLVLSDEALKIDSSSGSINLQGLSIIWQAITPNTQIVYGAPDPSKTITAAPPPLSPGQSYTWVVLNNYGNHPAFSSMKVSIPPGEFNIGGTPLKAPKPIYPIDNRQLTSLENNSFNFKWTNLDPAANTYKIYVYVGSDFQGINAKMTVWQNEVSAPANLKATDTMSVSIDAASVLTSNSYVWRAIAVDNKGAGSAGDTGRFHFSSPTGTMQIHTRENIVIAQNGKRDTIVSDVGLVKLEVQVLDGSMESPLLFYTDLSGNLDRTRPVGTYRVTALKDGFEPLTRTITVSNNDTTSDIFYLERPEATVYGRVLDESGKGINLAKVKGISDRGDTVSTQSDALGNFILNCYAADWNVNSEIVGYKSSLSRKITVTAGQSYEFGTITLERNANTVSGVVKNENGEALLGVKIQLLRDGVVIDEMPSTPQTGVFSFTVAPGTYTINASKAGFTSYSSTISILSSKSISITMTAGAAMINGYVVGRTWVNDKVVYAAVTNAKVVFVNKAKPTDTISTLTDAVYGNFTISLPGGPTYLMRTSANGFVTDGYPDTIVSAPKTTYNVSDTLRGLAMLAGFVKMKSTDQPISGVTINLINPKTGTVLINTKTSSDGRFELRGIVDGQFKVSGGKEGLVLDSVGGRDTILVSDGRVDIQTVTLYLKPGDKTIKWFFAGKPNFLGAIKMQSPIVKTFAPTDTLGKTGPGDYIVTIDAASDSVMDLAYHTFTLADSIVQYVDTVAMSVVHHAVDSLNSDSTGKITVTLTSTVKLDSVNFYYKDLSSQSYYSSKDSVSRFEYSFRFEPPKDGSVMQYYFRAYSGQNVFGYDKELYSTFIKPDITRLTKFELVPSTEDIMHFSSNYSVKFSFKGYASSAFIPVTTVNGDGISWKLLNAQGCSLDKSTGMNVTLRTSGAKSTSPVILVMSVDTTKISLAKSASMSDSIAFDVSGKSLQSIAITRIDSKNPNPISTSPTDRAEFRADGIDADSARVTISPVWSIQPLSAGSIGTDGVFKPSRNYVGHVRIFAQAGTIVEEYNAKDRAIGRIEGGLKIRFMITNKSTPDTATNNQGCSIVFPPHVVDRSDIGLLELTVPDLRNQMKRQSGTLRMADDLAYEITQLENVSLKFSAQDSIKLILDIPEKQRETAASGKQKFLVGLWSQDSLKWDSLVNSKTSSDGKTVVAKLAHFSRYAVLTHPGLLSGYLTVSPNPFSPYVKPVNEYQYFQKNGAPTPFGTCIKFKADMPEYRLQSAKVRIYNITGDLVWSIEIRNPKPDEYKVWWDGKTLDKEILADGDADNTVQIKGNEMCRNGRYFVVLLIKDIAGKQRQYMKPLVLMK